MGLILHSTKQMQSNVPRLHDAPRHVDFFRLAEMTREQAVEYIKDYPEFVHELIIMRAKSTMDGWMKRNAKHLNAVATNMG